MRKLLALLAIALALPTATVAGVATADAARADAAPTEHVAAQPWLRSASISLL